jgi:uncharacterized membrane protein
MNKKGNQKVNNDFLTFFPKGKKGGIMDNKLVAIILALLFLAFMMIFIFIIKGDISEIGSKFVNMFGG